MTHTPAPTDPLTRSEPLPHTGFGPGTGSLRLADLHELPPTLDLPTAARLLGIGRTTAYSLVHHGQFPCPTFKVGHQHRVATAVLLQFLGVTGAVKRPGGLSTEPSTTS